MLREDELLREVRGLRRRELRAWVAAGWVSPATEGGVIHFTVVDVARVRLIHTMRSELRVQADALPVVLSLLDQVHGLRSELRRLADAVAAQPEPVRRAIVSRVRDR